MPISSMPIAILMQRRAVQNRWVDSAWSAVGVVSNMGGVARRQTVEDTPHSHICLVPGLDLALYPDENDGYFENWIAPEPKVFVMWRLENDSALPVIASVSYGEGTRMLDSGESADGVAMAGDIHAWLGLYLKMHYQPRQFDKTHRRK